MRLFLAVFMGVSFQWPSTPKAVQTLLLIWQIVCHQEVASLKMHVCKMQANLKFIARAIRNEKFS